MDKPFYIRQLPEEAQKWLKEKHKESNREEGLSEEDLEKMAEDFLDEKTYTAEELYGKDFWKNIKSDPDEDTKTITKTTVTTSEPDDFDDYIPEEEKVLLEEGKSMPEGGSKTVSQDDIDSKLEDNEESAFQKALNEYMKKNPKGREDIPNAERRM